MAHAERDAPDAGEIIWVDLGPPFGHEQASRRPALVMSPRDYNQKSSFILVCPITRNPAAWPFKIQMPEVDRIKGAVLVDQIRSIDRHMRLVRRGGRIDTETLDLVYATLVALLGIAIR